MRRVVAMGAAVVALAGLSAGPAPPQDRPDPRTRVIVWRERSGFAWTDAAVGAGAALGVVLIVQGLVIPSIRRRRQ